jgi:hypothetical protein
MIWDGGCRLLAMRGWECSMRGGGGRTPGWLGNYYRGTLQEVSCKPSPFEGGALWCDVSGRQVQVTKSHTAMTALPLPRAPRRFGQSVQASVRN